MSEVKNFSTLANPTKIKWSLIRGSQTGSFCKHFKPPGSCNECHIDQIATIKGCMDLDSKFSSMGLNGDWSIVDTLSDRLKDISMLSGVN